MINTTIVFAAGAGRNELAVAVKIRRHRCAAAASATGGYASTRELTRRGICGLGNAIRRRRDAAALAVRPAPPRPLGLPGRRARDITPLRVHISRHLYVGAGFDSVCIRRTRIKFMREELPIKTLNKKVDEAAYLLSRYRCRVETESLRDYDCANKSRKRTLDKPRGRPTGESAAPTSP